MRKLLLVFCLVSVSQVAHSQFYSLRSNMGGILTGNLNIEGGMALNKRITIHLPIQYNPFTYSTENNTKFQNLTFMPGVRYWLNESYRNKFIGFYGIASRYNIGNIWDDYRYDGHALGTGLSFGSAYPISPKWNFEWEAGIGAVWCSYDKYVARRNGFHFGHYYRWHIIPSKISFNITFLF